jgi:ribokinase
LSPAAGPIVVVGAHAQGLFMQVEAVPKEGESVLGWDFDEPLDGGKATNQAVAAARLGAPVRLVTVLGRDERGRRALAYFEAQGIDTSWVVSVDGPTDMGFVVLPPSKIPAIATAQDRSRELNETTVGAAAEAIRGGSFVLSQLEAPQEAALAAFRTARAAGVATILNPAPALELDAELLALTDVLVPNEHEAAVLAGRDGAPGELSSELAGRLGVATVVVTAGDDGAYFVHAGESSGHVPAPRVEAADTTGAGDAFVAALAVQLRDGAPLADAVAFAVRAASLSVTRPGTMPAFPTTEEVRGWNS